MTYVYMLVSLPAERPAFPRKDCPFACTELAVFEPECPFSDLTKSLSLPRPADLVSRRNPHERFVRSLRARRESALAESRRARLRAATAGVRSSRVPRPAP